MTFDLITNDVDIFDDSFDEIVIHIMYRITLKTHQVTSFSLFIKLFFSKDSKIQLPKVNKLSSYLEMYIYYLCR